MGQSSILCRGTRQPCRRALSDKYLGNVYQESKDTDNGISPYRLWVRITGFHPVGQGSNLCGGTKCQRGVLVYDYVDEQ